MQRRSGKNLAAEEWLSAVEPSQMGADDSVHGYPVQLVHAVVVVSILYRARSVFSEACNPMQSNHLRFQVSRTASRPAGRF
jgi:hypothetical protein